MRTFFVRGKDGIYCSQVSPSTPGAALALILRKQAQAVFIDQSVEVSEAGLRVFSGTIRYSPQ